MKRSKRARLVAEMTARAKDKDDERIARAERDAGIIIVITLVLVILRLFIGGNSLLTALLFACIPLCILWIFLHRNSVELLGNDMRSVSTIMMMPLLICMALLFTSGPSHILHWQQVMAVAVLITIVLLLLFIFAMLAAGGISSLLLVCMVPLFYGASYHFVLQENRLLDKSNFRHYAVEIVDKEKDSRGKYKTYYFTLAQWREQPERYRITVPGLLYEDKKVGERLQLYYYDGAFQMPWFEIIGE